MDVLKDKQLRAYDKLSRYQNVPLYYHTLDNKYTYGITTHLKTTTPYSTYKIQSGDTLDSLALQFYGNPTYYWIIADFNRLTNAFIDLPEGRILKIPNKSDIDFEDE